MALKRKTRNLPNLNDGDKRNQMSFFDPVYQNDDDDDYSASGLARQNFRDQDQDESSETLNADPTRNAGEQNEDDEEADDENSLEISTARIVARIKQIQNSIQQAQTMLDSMDRLKHLVPGSDDQCEKLRVIIANLQEQQDGYVNLLNLITSTNEERSVLASKLSAIQREALIETDNRPNDERDDDQERNSKPVPQRRVQFPGRPRIESKIGFDPSTPSILPPVNTSDNEQNARHDNSNYDSLVGSLKSDTLNWKDQQSTSDDEASEAGSEKEMEKNLMLQKEQLRALQGQKRALLALKKRSEERLLEQQQQLTSKKTTLQNEESNEDNLLSDINNLRDRLQLLRSLYEQKHEVEVQQVKSSSRNQPSKPVVNRRQNLEHVRSQLDELEQIVTYYQLDLMDQPEEETTVYEEAQIQPDDVHRLQSLLVQQKQQAASAKPSQNESTAQPLDKLSNELAAKRLELEQAKFALSRLQQMVKTIEPEEASPSVRPAPNPSTSSKPTKTTDQQTTTVSNPKSSVPSSVPSSKPNSILTTNTYADVQMAAQHREIERLVESRQRLHTLKDQIASLHQSMTTPPIPLNRDLVSMTQAEQTLPKKSPVNTPTLRRDEQIDLYRFNREASDEEDTEEEIDEEIQPRIKQGNFHAPEDIVAEHERRLLNKQADRTDDLSAQMREVCRCLSTFIEEQKSFNRHIEEHLTAATNNSSRTPLPSPSNSTGDVLFSQLHQQVLTQGLIVNLNTAYREIAVLQSEINGLQAENNRLTSSLSSYESQAQKKAPLQSRDNSKESLFSFEQGKPPRTQTRPKLNEYVQPVHSNLLADYNRFENSSKTSLSSQSTGKRTAINFEQKKMETTPIKYERNTTFTSDRLTSPKPMLLNSKQLTDKYDMTSDLHRHSSRGVPSKSFIIRRRPITNENDAGLTQSPAPRYEQQLRQNTFDDDDDEDDNDDDDDEDEDDVEEEEEEEENETDDEQQKDDLSRTILNTQIPPFGSASAQELNNIDVQTLNLQVKAVMVQLIPFMRLQINETFNQSILSNIRDRLIFLFKRQSNNAELVSHFTDQLADSLDKTTEKYFGTIIRDCAADLIRDISDVVFDELVRYKVIKETTVDSTTTKNEDPSMESLNKQQNEFANLYYLSDLDTAQETALINDGENDNKYQIELAASESRPLTLVGSDEEDNESDQEQNQDSELETAVSRQEINLNQHETTSSSESNSNGLGYVMVNRSTSNDTVDGSVPDEEEKKNQPEETVNA